MVVHWHQYLNISHSKRGQYPNNKTFTKKRSRNTNLKTTISAGDSNLHNHIAAQGSRNWANSKCRHVSASSHRALPGSHHGFRASPHRSFLSFEKYVILIFRCNIKVRTIELSTSVIFTNRERGVNDGVSRKNKGGGITRSTRNYKILTKGVNTLLFAFVCRDRALHGMTALSKSVKEKGTCQGASSQKSCEESR